MKYLFLLIPFVLFARIQVSPIPLPQTYVLNMDIYPCDEKCMIEYYNNGYIFSFLAHSDAHVQNTQLNEKLLIYKSIFNVVTPIKISNVEQPAVATTNQEETKADESTDEANSTVAQSEQATTPISIPNGSGLKVALLLPYKVIGRYASLTTSSVFAYMLAKNTTFELKSYEIENESNESISSALLQIKNDGFEYVIAPLTKTGVNNIIQLAPELKIFFPTINKNSISTDLPNLYFGGIDYNAQIDKLIAYSASPLVIFYDNSDLAQTLSEHAKESYLAHGSSAIHTYQIEKQTSNLKNELQYNSQISHGSFILNTPIVKSSMIMSQMTLYNVDATNILSTQINYDPIILSMTQNIDRQKMIIANSIGTNNQVIVEINSLLENDIVYDWINYATTVGVDYFNNVITGSMREYDLEMRNNQIIYPVNLVKPTYSKFENYVE